MCEAITGTQIESQNYLVTSTSYSNLSLTVQFVRVTRPSHLMQDLFSTTAMHETP